MPVVYINKNEMIENENAQQKKKEDNPTVETDPTDSPVLATPVIKRRTIIIREVNSSNTWRIESKDDVEGISVRLKRNL